MYYIEKYIDNGKCGFVLTNHTKNGNIKITDTIYDDCQRFSTHIVWYRIGLKYGYLKIDMKTGKILKDSGLQFDHAKELMYRRLKPSESIAIASKNKKYGAINMNLETVIPFIYDKICKPDYIIMMLFVIGNRVNGEMLYGIYDCTRNKELFPPQFKSIKNNKWKSDNTAQAQTMDNKVVTLYYDGSIKTITDNNGPSIYSIIKSTHNKTFDVDKVQVLNKKWGLQKNGIWIVPPVYKSFAQGFANCSKAFIMITSETSNWQDYNNYINIEGFITDLKDYIVRERGF